MGLVGSCRESRHVPALFVCAPVMDVLRGIVTITLWGMRTMRKILIAFAVLVSMVGGAGLSIGVATPAHADYVK